MRELKFRAWDGENKVFYYWSLNDLLCRFGNKEYSDDTTASPFFEWDEFTGLKDRNGKEIYEGDVLKTDSGANMKVEYRNDMACFVCRFDKGGSTNIEKDWKVIGSIYENPELLDN